MIGFRARVEPRTGHAIAFGEPFALPGGLTGNFTRAGHTIGAASLCVDDGARRVLFSGDLGREQDIMMAPPESRPPADVIVLESTYGGRQHDGDDPGDVLAELIRRTVIAAPDECTLARASLARAARAAW